MIVWLTIQLIQMMYGTKFPNDELSAFIAFSMAELTVEILLLVIVIFIFVRRKFIKNDWW